MSIPPIILRSYGLPDHAELDVQHVHSNINATFIVRQRRHPEREPLVLQRVHAVFGPTVHVDIEAVTRHLAARGHLTPRLIRTREGQLWAEEPGAAAPHIWRALSHVQGVTLHSTSDAARLASAAELLGSFHQALSDLQHEFVHHRPLHDTPQHLERLRAALASSAGQGDAEAQAVGSRVLEQAASARLDFAALPRRIIHGDPKLSNVMFRADGPARASCMIDLDTVGRGYLAYELGDAVRSWCNPLGEDTSRPHVDLAAFAAVIRGYLRSCPADVAAAELLSVVDGVETVSVELSSRFAADVIRDEYFGWDRRRFASRREHNLLRARGQLELSRSVSAARPALEREVREALASRSLP